MAKKKLVNDFVLILDNYARALKLEHLIGLTGKIVGFLDKNRNEAVVAFELSREGIYVLQASALVKARYLKNGIKGSETDVAQAILKEWLGNWVYDYNENNIEWIIDKPHQKTGLVYHFNGKEKD
jgi:hypothetical protein